MSTILSRQNISDSISEVEQYITSANALYEELKGVIDTLTASGFIGEASDGYKTFFTSKITPALTTTLVEGDTSLMGSIRTMMSDIGEQFMDNIDPQLREANESAGEATGE